MWLCKLLFFMFPWVLGGFLFFKKNHWVWVLEDFLWDLAKLLFKIILIIIFNRSGHGFKNLLKIISPQSQLIENWESSFKKGTTFDDDTMKYSRWELDLNPWSVLSSFVIPAQHWFPHEARWKHSRINIISVYILNPSKVIHFANQRRVLFVSYRSLGSVCTLTKWILFSILKLYIYIFHQLQ